MRTEGAVLFELQAPLRLIDLTIPELQAGQVLVDLAFSGVCHTQVMEVRGARGPDSFLPHTLGHEGSGIVVATGSAVRKVRRGDHVVVSWIKGSGTDVPSTTYQSKQGPINSGAVSTFMRTTVTCENRVTRIDSRMPLREAALLGCAVPTGAGIILNTAKLKPGESVAVFGVGGIGLSVVLAAALSNPSVIIAVDVVQDKLEQAKKIGATHLIDSKKVDAGAAILELTKGSGVDYAIVAVGNCGAMETAFRAVRANGGLCIIAGNVPYGQQIGIDPMDLIKGKRLIGTWGGETNTDSDVPAYVDLYQKGKLDLTQLITHEYPLAEINDAIDNLERGKMARGLINLESSAR